MEKKEDKYLKAYWNLKRTHWNAYLFFIKFIYLLDNNIF
jgi:hypothetical protein